MTPKRLPPLRGAAHLLAALALAGLLPAQSAAQSATQAASPDRSAAELYRLVNGLTVTPRVLVIGMHPDDEDSELIAWLSRGRNVETAYLSITRGEAGLSFGGLESGSLLGAVRTQEALAARRLDGAKLFYTRAYDFGFARNTDDVLKRWDRDSIVGDIVAVIRAFRPQVIVAMLSDSVIAADGSADSDPDGDGQHQALALFVDHAFTAAADPTRFPSSAFGAPWAPAKMYRPGPGLRIETAEYDRMLGTTYAALAIEARAQQRSQGLIGLTLPRATVVELRRIRSRVGDSAAVDQSLFGAVDTTFARLAADAPDVVAKAIPAIAAYADSARRVLDPAHPSAAVPFLSEIVRLTTRARGWASSCRHPSVNSAAGSGGGRCEQQGLDLDASIDLARDRSVAALLIAAGVSFEVTADRELLAKSDTSDVTVTMFNRGTARVTLADVSLWGAFRKSIDPIIVPPDSAAHVVARVTGLAESGAWWVTARGGKARGGERFDDILSTADGLTRGGPISAAMRVPAVAIPENIRRTSDATVTVSVAGTTVKTNLGPVLSRHADAFAGLQDRPLGGIPDVTIQFARGLEWIPRNKPVTRPLRVAIKSHSDREREFEPRIVTPQGMPKGLRVDSLPKSIRLAPHEQRELFIQLRGTLVGTDRDPIGLIGIPPAGVPSDTTNRPATHGPIPLRAAPPYQSGLRTVQRDYLPPIRIFPSPGEWLQPIDIEVPPSLTTLYIPGVGDDVATALKQIGVWATEVTTPDQLLSVDLSKVTTIAVGARAFEAQPELLGQVGRLLEFARKGGTLVVLRGDAATVSSRLFPYPLELARPVAERVTRADAPVVMLDPKARVLNWPNKISPVDWEEWIGQRALSVPTIADPRYTKIVEVHDVGEKENRNAILVARVGKGTIVYTTLTLDQQIAGGVPGALRLFVNLLSAGLPLGK